MKKAPDPHIWDEKLALPPNLPEPCQRRRQPGSGHLVIAVSGDSRLIPHQHPSGNGKPAAIR